MAKKKKPHAAPPMIEEVGSTAADDGHGAEYAPTQRATEMEAERHHEEEARGHFAAGVDGRRRAVEVAVDDDLVEDLDDE